MRSSKKLPSRLAGLLSLATAALFPSATAHAQSHPEYVPLGRAKGALYRPDTGQARVGILLTHRTSNFLSHPACTEFATRGFVVLCTGGSTTTRCRSASRRWPST
jgi:hypothetical protein